MPQPIEAGEKFGRLQVVQPVKGCSYGCRCARCKFTVIVAARSLRLRHDDVNCQRCFPRSRQPRRHVFYDLHGWAEVEAA
jgi:hypothetical protein